MKWIKGVCIGWGVAAALLVYPACETLGPESNSGPDGSRLGATSIELNTLYMDYLSCVEGDSTDWKYFSTPGRSLIAVSFAFDAPEAGGTVVIRTPDVEEIARARFVPGARTTIQFDAVREFYYVQVFCEGYESEYSLEVSIP